MLREIAKVWRRGGLMKDVVDELAQMIVDAEYVFTRAWEVCSGQAIISTTKEPLRERDKLVNEQERKIRRMLVEHMSINPGSDASGCLAVMAMAKDAERIGDLAKDIFKLGAELDGKGRELAYFERLDSVQKLLLQNFPRLQQAIRESSDEIAHEILYTYGQVKTPCKDMINDLLKDDLPTREATITALLIHNFTRINAHIGNAASGVIFPIENIDFVSRGLREEKKREEE